MMGMAFPTAFSPYSRGWSPHQTGSMHGLGILPVFAGMVRNWPKSLTISPNSPRIRGDGPIPNRRPIAEERFSPYSRGWSALFYGGDAPHQILPVFAGMVRGASAPPPTDINSPRIRGDGPNPGKLIERGMRFSPYSRGWSPNQGRCRIRVAILPVFAGMVPHAGAAASQTAHSPRIRGDGPMSASSRKLAPSHSPRIRGDGPVFWGGRPGMPRDSPRIRGDGPDFPLRGWILRLSSPVGYLRWRPILPVFAGMAPPTRCRTPTRRHFPRIRGDGPSFTNAEPEWSVFSPYLRG